MLRIKGRPVINVDHDGPLYNFPLAFHRWAQIYTGDTLVYPITKWKFWEQWDMSVEKWLKIFEAGILHGALWEAGDVVPGAVEGMRQLSEMDYHIRIVTSKLGLKGLNAKAIESTVGWLDTNLIPYRSVSFLSHGESKSNYAANILIDDNPDIVRDWASSTDNWARAVLFDAPYNRQQETVGENYVSGIYYRATNWDDVVALVRKEVPND